MVPVAEVEVVARLLSVVVAVLLPVLEIADELFVLLVLCMDLVECVLEAMLECIVEPVALLLPRVAVDVVEIGDVAGEKSALAKK